MTTALSALTTGASAYGATVDTGVRMAAFLLAPFLLALVTNIGLFLLAFRVLTASQIPSRHLRLGAIVAGIGGNSCSYLAPTSSATRSRAPARPSASSAWSSDSSPGSTCCRW